MEIEKLQELAMKFVNQEAPEEERKLMAAKMADDLSVLFVDMALEACPEEEPGAPISGNAYEKVDDLRYRVGKLRGVLVLSNAMAHRRREEIARLREKTGEK